MKEYSIIKPIILCLAFLTLFSNQGFSQSNLPASQAQVAAAKRSYEAIASNGAYSESLSVAVLNVLHINTGMTGSKQNIILEYCSLDAAEFQAGEKLTVYSKDGNITIKYRCKNVALKGEIDMGRIALME